MKNFSNWFALKPRLDDSEITRLINEREVWWCSMGVNVGHEMDGKSTKASRPVLILRKLSKNFFIGLPLTSKDKFGTWYVPITLKHKTSRVILSQVRVFDSRRLTSKIGQLDKNDFYEVKKQFISLIS